MIINKERKAFISKNFFGFDYRDFTQIIFGNIAADSYKDMLMLVGGNMETGMKIGDMHFISACFDENEN